MHQFRDSEPFRPWLLTIVANAARTRRSATVRHPTLALSAAAAIPDTAVPSPEAAALNAERRRELLAAVNALSDLDRTVIACRYFLDLSEPEIASVLRCARGTVKSRLSRAMSRLRRQLSDATGLSAANQAQDLKNGGRDD